MDLGVVKGKIMGRSKVLVYFTIVSIHNLVTTIHNINIKWVIWILWA
jgi:hypothetical protein